MRRSRARKPQLSLTRTYAGKFASVNWREFILREISDIGRLNLRDIRVAVYSLAADLLATAYEGKCHACADIELDGNLTLKISVNDEFPDVDCITARSLEQATEHTNKAFQSFYKLIPESIDKFLQADRAGGRMLGNLSPYDVERNLFGTNDVQITTSTVEFDVGSRVAAVTRNSECLESLAERSVLAYYEKEPPRLGQYDIKQSEGPSLQIDGHEKGVAEDVSAVLLGQPRGPQPQRSIDRWPPATTLYWGVNTLALAIFAVAIAAVRITPVWLVVTGLGAAMAVGSALLMARRGGALLSNTALGMSPSIIVLGFAVYYGSLMMGSDPAVTVAATGAPHLVDTFLLSLSLASTGGLFDLGLHTTVVRVVAFAEMLLIVSVAGRSLYIGAHAVLDKLGQMLGTNVQG